MGTTLGLHCIRIAFHFSKSFSVFVFLTSWWEINAWPPNDDDEKVEQGQSRGRAGALATKKREQGHVKP
jgi:hypothetical protein